MSAKESLRQLRIRRAGQERGFYLTIPVGWVTGDNFLTRHELDCLLADAILERNGPYSTKQVSTGFSVAVPPDMRTEK